MADEDTTQGEERLVDVVASFVAGNSGDTHNRARQGLF